MAQDFVTFWKPAVDHYCVWCPWDTQMLGEIGIDEVNDGSLIGDAHWSITHKELDGQEVADTWHAYLKGSQELGTDRINVWMMPLEDYAENEATDLFLNNGSVTLPNLPFIAS